MRVALVDVDMELFMERDENENLRPVLKYRKLFKLHNGAKQWSEWQAVGARAKTEGPKIEVVS